MSESIVCIGVGNDFRHDDAVGLVVARGLREVCPVIEQSGEGASLVHAWEGHDRVILIDATCSGAPPGTIHRFAAHLEPLPVELFATTTHAFGVAAAVEVARMLGQLPAELLIFGVEGADFSMGVGLTPAVQTAADLLMREIGALVSMEGEGMRP